MISPAVLVPAAPTDRIMAEVLHALRPVAPAAGPADRLEADLGLDSLALAAFDAALRARFGARVDLAGHLATLELDELIALTVGGVVDYLAGLLAPAG